MMPFLDLSDDLIAAGISHTSESFRDSLRSFVLSRQLDSGAFGSPAGDADLYYTEFALRTLTVLQCESGPLERAAGWISQQRPSDDPIQFFSYLNARRLLARRDILLPAWSPSPLPLHSGSAYRLFLGLLSRELLQTPIPSDAVAMVLALGCDDGGFSESSDYPASQTNATSAALAVLLLCERADDSRVQSGCEYLQSQQRSDGGFVAHSGLVHGDLLSSFTAMLSLAMLGQVPSPKVNLAPLARFLRLCHRASGGFAAEPSTAYAADVEYTYYGLALTAILRNLVEVNPE